MEAYLIEIEAGALGVALGEHEVGGAGIDDETDRHAVHGGAQVIVAIRRERGDDAACRQLDRLPGQDRLFDMIPHADACDHTHENKAPEKRLLGDLAQRRAVLDDEPEDHRRAQHDEIDQMGGVEILHQNLLDGSGAQAGRALRPSDIGGGRGGEKPVSAGRR
ncbi:hypothetical protein ACM25N_04965 [Roseovarius sp. C7]|uniref:hypothetical protein n=1 Tax=Roseovarius sp. C7 TaxID=3398643 RepID=UPI0039F683A6